MKSTISYVLAALMAASTSPALASENANQQYPVGVNTVANGFVPPQLGTLELYNYTQLYDSTRYNGPHGDSLVSDFHLNIKANVPRLLYTPNIDLGGFRWTTGIVVPIVQVETRAFGRTSKSSGLSNIILENYIARTSRDFKVSWYAGLDVFLPTGKYDKNVPSSVGINYITYAPAGGITYMPNRKYEFNAAYYVEFNERNKATDYHSGADVTFDYSANVRPFMRKMSALQLGVNGYAYWQFQDDDVHGVKIGNRGRAFAIGPQIRYDLGATSGVIFKYQREFGVQNRPSGNRFWIEFAFPLYRKSLAAK